MFGFRNRKQYNGNVDVKLTDGYGIKTRDNSYFPGVLAYLELIDNAWAKRLTEEAAAMFIAYGYYAGLLRQGLHDEARALSSRMATVSVNDFVAGRISKHQLATFAAAVDSAKATAKADE